MNASATATESPRIVTNRMPMGATGIGRHGRKWRVSENGHNKATPLPPSVSASRIPCDATTRPAIAAAPVHGFRRAA
jgi:hypothetical protein